MQALRSGGGRRAVPALPLVAAAVAALATLDVLYGGPLRHFDHRVFASGPPPRDGGWHVFWRIVVNGGQYWLVGTLAAVTAAVVAWRRRDLWLLVRAAAWLLGTELVIRAAQVWTGRTPPRTGVDLLHASGYVSYPSGHAANAAACLLFAAGLARASRGAAAAVHVLVVGVAFATVALGYHWPTDSIGGWGLGVLLGWAGLRLVDRGVGHLEPARR